MSKYKIGDILGSNSSLLIIDKEKCIIGKSEKLKYKVQCQICKHDSELHGNAEYLVYPEYFVNGKLPCGCSKSTRYSDNQWRIVIKRKAASNNHDFIDFADGKYASQDSKLLLKCNDCGHKWNSCSVVNYMKDRGCPCCATVTRAMNNTTSDDEWINRFRQTGFFPEQKYSFERITSSGRTWKVKCIVCGDKEFISDRANLTTGKVPCDCGTGGGFDVNKTGYFYILTVKVANEIFIKYGISNFYKRRITDHIRTLKTVQGEVLEKVVFTSTGDVVLEIESSLKREIPSHNRFMEGFRKESCSIEFYNKIFNTLVFDDRIEKVVIDS